MTLLSTILTQLAAALTSLGMLLGIVHAPAPSVTATYVPIATSTQDGGTTAGLIPSDLGKSTKVSASGQFTDTNWSLAFTLRPEWNVNEILDSTDKLHQMQISGSAQVIFVSKNEAIALSSDLKHAASTQTIAGESITVQTYPSPSPAFAYYQLFSIPESDGTYYFLLKSTTQDTTITDAFIKSIVLKK